MNEDGRLPTVKSPSIMDATVTKCTQNDLSPIYLRQHKIDASTCSLPILGPIQISSTNVIEGRGLIATKDIQPGECLFVIPPAVSVPVEEAKRVWLKKVGSNAKVTTGCSEDGSRKIKPVETMEELTMSLEKICEVILIKRMKRLFKLNDDEKKKGAQQLAAMSILSQVGDHFDHDNGSDYQTNDLNVVAGIKSLATSPNSVIDPSKLKEISNDEILSIIHRNAFGPDYRQYQSIAQYWMSHSQSGSSSSSSSNTNPYGRILGLYPLAAMINHSCTPNAIRVYSCSAPSSNGTTSSTDNTTDEVMIVHATKPIKKGEEIVWSYIPTTKPYHDRQRRLRENFGFESKCHRSQMEALFFENCHSTWTSKYLDEYARFNETAMDMNNILSMDKLQSLMDNFENMISDKSIPSETSRFLRGGMLTFYTNYFNAILSQRGNDDDIQNSVLNLASKMHLSLVSVDHGTTEHLSILHLCYELAVQQSQKNDGKKNLPKFWAGQLQKAHECRYGRLGGRVDTVRAIMVHSRCVLRNRNGFENVKYCFI